MRPVVIALTAATAIANSTPIPTNWRQSPFNMQLTFKDSGTTTGFTVQWTNDSPQDYASAALWNSAATWFDHSTMTGMKAAAYGGIDYPVTGVRLHCDASGTDTGTLTIRQGQNG